MRCTQVVVVLVVALLAGCHGNRGVGGVTPDQLAAYNNTGETALDIALVIAQAKGAGESDVALLRKKLCGVIRGMQRFDFCDWDQAPLQVVQVDLRDGTIC